MVRVYLILHTLGFTPDAAPDAPICRLRYGLMRVDFMPVDGSFLGFRSRWFRAACAAAWRYPLAPDLHIRVAGAPQLLATKAEAFADRGEGDFEASKDVEDFLAVVDGRDALVSEVDAAPEDVRTFLRETIAGWLADRDFRDSLSGHLRGDHLRVPILLRRLATIARSANAD